MWDMAVDFYMKAQNQRLTSPLGHKRIDLHQRSQELEGNLEARLFPGRGKIKVRLHCIMNKKLYLHEFSGYCMKCIPIEIDH